MTDYIAEPADVRLEIDTGLSDSEIDRLIARTARDIDREYETHEYESDGDFDDDVVRFKDAAHRRDFEALLTAQRIVGSRDRAEQSESVASHSVTFETNVIDNLRARVAKLDPGRAFTPAGAVVRDDERHVRSTNRTSDE